MTHSDRRRKNTKISV